MITKGREHLDARSVQAAHAGPSGAGSAGVRATQWGLSVGGIGFNWAISLLAGVFVAGLFLDGWAHTHGRVDESFCTPWHAILLEATYGNL